ncbi:unnamed protein product [Musa acuminata subsp. burmannicoides]
MHAFRQRELASTVHMSVRVYTPRAIIGICCFNSEARWSFIHYDLVLITYEDDDGNNVHLEMKTGRRADDAGSGSKSVQVHEPLLPGAMLLRHQLRPCLPDRGLQRWALPRSPAPVHVPEERLLKRALS